MERQVKIKLPAEIRERDCIPPFHYDGIMLSKGRYRLHRILNKNGDVLITSNSEAMAKLIVHALNTTYPEQETESCAASEETT